ncbi:MAG: hypothetical protein ACYTGL_05760 [Planctomycetota bacterium]
MRLLHLTLLLLALTGTGCQTAADWIRNTGLFKSNPQPTPFSEAADAWDGTWAEQKEP